MFGFVDQTAADAASEMLRIILTSCEGQYVTDIDRIQQGIESSLSAVRGDAKGVAEYLDANPNQLDNRTVFQSTLLHIAARNGRLQVALELLNRGIDVNALDYVCPATLSLLIPVRMLTLYSSLQMPDLMLFRSAFAAVSPALHRATVLGGLHMHTGQWYTAL